MKNSREGRLSRGRLAIVGTGVVLSGLLCAFCLSPGVAGASRKQAASKLTGSLVIATQPDLGYSPLYIVHQEHWLTKVMPGVKVTWDTFNSGSAMETAMVSGTVDVGAGGVAPFIIGWAKGVGWKLLSSLGESNLWLVAKKTIKSVKDLTSSDHIAVVAPTSIQAIILEKAAQKYLHNPNALTPDLTILSHPVAYQAFKSGTIQAALDAPPFEQEEVAAGGHVLITSYKLFGPSTFNSAFVLQSFYSSHQKMMTVLYQQIERAVKLLNSNPTEASKIISAYEHGTLSVKTAKADITSKTEHWTVVPHGYLEYAKFMKSVGLISKAPSSMHQLDLPTLSGSNQGS
jgi:NitT/TauT family transport system substrate-binding protein